MPTHVQLLNEHSLKATFQRTQILDVIEKHGHIAIEAIYNEVSKVHSSLSLSTIYKNIIMMVAKGVLQEVPISGEKSKYEIKKDDHIHLVCKKCNKIEDHHFDKATISNTLRIANDSSFILEHRQLNLYGICASCSL